MHPSSRARLSASAIVSDESVDFHHAFKLIPTIQFCVEMYQSTISATPLKFYVGEGDTKTELERSPGNVVDLWSRGNTEDKGSDLIEQIVGSRQLQGNAYLFKDYMGRGTPQQFWCLNPLLVRPIAGKGGRGVVEYEVRDGATFVRIPRQQIVHFKRYDPDLGLTGVSRVGALRLAYETQRDGARFMRAFYKRGGTVAGHYSTDSAMDPDEVDALKKDLHERVQGPEHAWEPVILPRKLKFERAGLTFAEMQFIESEKMTTEQMLRVFRIHPILASQAVSAGLNSDVASTAMLMFLRFGVMPEARSIAGTLTERLLSTGEFGRNISCEFDFANDPVLVEAWLKQADAWSKATGAPVATRSEARDKLGLPDRDDEFPTLDEPLVPVGMITEGESASPGADPVASSTSKPPASVAVPTRPSRSSGISRIVSSCEKMISRDP
jgi:HK97 family phage portal protein